MLHKMSITMLALILATPALAIVSQPIAEDASVTPAGTIRMSGGVTLESDFQMYGVRGSYTLIDGLTAFLGAGIADPDFWGTGPYIQAGGSYALPNLNLPVDLALRGGLGFTTFSRGGADLDITSFNGGLLASAPVHDMVTLYGFGGLSIVRTEVSGSFAGFRSSTSDTDTEPAIAVGGMFDLDQNISFYGELAHIDELFISVGARYTF